MDIALYMGKIIHCDLCYGNMSGWSYWTVFATERYSQKNRFYLIRMNATGDTGDESYGDIKKGGRLTVDKNLWVLGNYSRFIRPGYKRVAIKGADDLNGLMGSSWLSPDEKTLVTVFVNMSQASKKVGITVADNAIESMKAYLTDKNNSLKLQSSLNDASQMEIPARSVVTIVAQLSNATGIHATLSHKSSDNKFYKLNGLPTSQPQKGVHIYNGQKYIVQ